MRGFYDPSERGPSGRAEALEAGELRLDRYARRARRFEDTLAPAGNCVPRPIRRRFSGGVRVRRPRDSGIGVKAYADLTRALFDERREPICEGGTRGLRQLPLT
jgi:hypothetical protein